MNIKAMRNVHLYLGVFFAPLLLFFLVTGCLQTFTLHEQHKNDGYKPPQMIKSLSQVHQDQRWTLNEDDRPEPSKPFRIFVLLMSLGLFVTTILGILMAFKYTRAGIVWACLLGGIAIPFFFIWIAMSGRP